MMETSPGPGKSSRAFHVGLFHLRSVQERPAEVPSPWRCQGRLPRGGPCVQPILGDTGDTRPGELTVCNGKPPFLMGKTTINGYKWPFSIAMLVHQRVSKKTWLILGQTKEDLSNDSRKSWFINRYTKWDGMGEHLWFPQRRHKQS